MNDYQTELARPETGEFTGFPPESPKVSLMKQVFLQATAIVKANPDKCSISPRSKNDYLELRAVIDSKDGEADGQYTLMVSCTSKPDKMIRQIQLIESKGGRRDRRRYRLDISQGKSIESDLAEQRERAKNLEKTEGIQGFAEMFEQGIAEMYSFGSEKNIAAMITDQCGETNLTAEEALSVLDHIISICPASPDDPTLKEVLERFKQGNGEKIRGLLGA